MEFDIIILGGGAGGFFSALSAAKANPKLRIAIIERFAKVLSKVKVSGGGRCNVTHNCFEPKQLVQNYPRGNKELLGPFHQFNPEDTIRWFNEKGVEIVAERDGRMFPTTNSSQTIIECFLQEVDKLGIQLILKEKIEKIDQDNDSFVLKGKDNFFFCKKLVLATGSSKEGFTYASNLGHTIIDPIPSLFTFHVPSSPLLDLSGISIQNAKVQLINGSYVSEGPVLLTHFGFSGPAILKLSAWEAQKLHETNYKYDFVINWINTAFSLAFQQCKSLKNDFPAKTLLQINPYHFPKKFLKRQLEVLGEKFLLPMQNFSTRDIERLVQKFTQDTYSIDGKTMNKEEFVTCGGICTKEVNFKTMESRKTPGLYFTGEILNIDGITGGFNFQNAWTTGYIAGKNAANAIA